jgi:hypothetical protein
MRYEEAVRLMLREGKTIRRFGWPEGKCMFLDVKPGYHRQYIVAIVGWDNDFCSLVSEDLLAEDWELCACPDPWPLKLAHS